METETKTLFQHLHKELLEYQTRFIDVSLKCAGLTFLLLGWLLTSEPARKFVGTSAKGRAVIVGGIILMVAAYLTVAARMSAVMQSLARQMDALDYLPRSYYDFRALPPKIIAAAATASVIPAMVTIAFAFAGAK